MEIVKKKGKQGLASMTPERRKEIASMGGKTAHAKGVAHEWTSDQARMAGKKGGNSVKNKPGHMAKIGAIGGSAKKSICLRCKKLSNELENNRWCADCMGEAW